MSLLQPLLFDFVNQHKQKFGWYLLIILIVFPLETVGVSRLFSHLFLSFNKTINYNNILHIILLILIVFVVIIIGNSFKNYLELQIIPSYVFYMRNLLFSHSIHYYRENYKDIKLGRFIANLYELSSFQVELLNQCLNVILPVSLALLIIISYFFYVNVTIGGIGLTAVLISGVLIVYLGQFLIQQAIKTRSSFLTSADAIQDKFSNLMNIYINNKQDTEIAKYAEAEIHNKSKFTNLLSISTFMYLCLAIVCVCAVAIIFFMVYKFHQQKKISTEIFVTIGILLIYFINFLTKLGGSSPNCFRLYGYIAQAFPFLTQILSSSSTTTNSTTHGVNHQPSSLAGDIVFSNVSFKYKNNSKSIFDHLNVTFSHNKLTVLVGETGIGKTTLIKLLLKMYPIEHGHITINGLNINEIDTTFLRDQLTYINQRTVLFDDTVLKNIQYGNNQTDDSIIMFLQKYDLLTPFKHLGQSDKFGIYANCGVNGNNLSMGLQKIVMLVRGVLRQSAFYLFDEPLTSLDEQTRKKIIKMIIGETVNKTVIIITHDNEILPYADNLIYFNQLVSGAGGAETEEMETVDAEFYELS